MKVNGYTPPDLKAPKASGSDTSKVQPDAVKSASRAVADPSVAVALSSNRGLGRDSQNAASVVDSKKVATVKAAIANGSFKVDAEAIADKLLSNTQDMLGVQPR